MQESRVKNSVRSTIAGSANKFVTMLFPFITRTIIIKELGIDYIGLNGLFSSILSVLSISELGFGSAMVYSMYKPVAEGNTDKICALLKQYKKIYQRVGLFILAAGLCLLPFLDHFISGTYPDDVNLTVLYLLYLFNSVISYFIFSYKGSILSATQREDVNSNILMITNIGMYVFQIIILFTVKKYMAYIVVMPIMTIANNIIRSIVVNKMYPQYKCEGSLSKEELHAIYKNVSALVGHRISGTIILSADNIVISAVLGLTAVACYGNYYYIVNALVGFFMVYFNAIRPSIGNSIVTESVEKNYKDFRKITLITAWIAGWCSICLLCLFQPFIKLWVGEEYLLSLGVVVILSFYFYEWKLIDVFVVYRDAAGMWWSDRFRPYVVAVLNIVGNITLVYFMGLEGVVLSTLLTSFLISFPWVLRVLFKEYFKFHMRKYCGYLFKISFVVIVTAVITYGITCLVPNTGILNFIVKIAICIIAPNLIFLVTLGRLKEFRDIKNMLIKRKL